MLSTEILDALTEEIVDGLSVISEAGMRIHSFIGKISSLEHQDIAEIFKRIIEGANGDEVKYHIAMSCIIDIPTLSGELGNEMMSDIYTYARDNEMDTVVSLMIRPSAFKKHDVLEHYSESSVPLGMKISLSKTQDKNLLDRLMNDGNPMVIRTILQSPLLTERDVIKISSKRPIHALILEEIYRNKKWISRYSVKKSLVLNPYSPTEIGLRLVHFLLAQDLRLVCDIKNIHPEIKKAAEERLKSIVRDCVPYE